MILKSIRKIKYNIKNKQIIAKLFIIFIYLVLFILSIVRKVIPNKSKIYFFQDRFFGIDNSYFLYKHYKKNHPEIRSIYLIKNKQDASYKGVIGEKGIVRNFSFKHFWFFLSAEKNFFSFNNAPFYLNGKIGNLIKITCVPHTQFIFLQHGVIRSYIEYYRKDNQQYIDYIVSSSKIEKNFLKESMGYGNEVINTGLARFDDLFNNSKKENKILFFPTWNRFLNGLNKSDFMKTDYYIGINNLLTNKELNTYLKNNKTYMYFYPHQGLSAFINCFDLKEFKNIIIYQDIDSHGESIQSLIKKCSLLITNYSSIVFDFAYQKKKVIYLDIGEDHLDKKAPYYYSFGDKYNNINGFIEDLDNIFQNNFRIKEKYIKNINIFFTNVDNKNCARINNLIN